MQLAFFFLPTLSVTPFSINYTTSTYLNLINKGCTAFNVLMKLNLPSSDLCLCVSRYVKSRSDKQLRNKEYEDETKDCFPLAKINNDDSKPIVPCGLIAWSLFNDTYKFAVNNKALEVDKKDIAWKSDKDYKFGSEVFPKNFQTEGMIGGGKLNESIPVSIPLYTFNPVI